MYNLLLLYTTARKNAVPDETNKRDYRPEEACDAPEQNETVQAYLMRCWWLPRSVKVYMWGRLEIGYKRYGKRLRMGWDKADEYLAEEEYDMLTYGIAGGRFVYVFVIGWIVWLKEAVRRSNLTK